jgi:hypothetical protein
VRDKDGNALLLVGDTITQETVDAAKAAGRMPQLVMAAGSGPAQNSLGSFGEQAAQSLRDIPNEARTLWNQLTGGYNNRVDMADTRAVDRRVKDALGRPVTRVILDGNDNIILNTGDIVTNHAIQAARQAGVLDILIDSIYTARPKLEVQDLKASRSGDASLEHVSGQPIEQEPVAAVPVEETAPQPQSARRVGGSGPGTPVVDNGPAGV